ncbi:hypothetical protein BCR35DRAFT_311677 [Leucosporidium creatinivorum]|uniref:Uncharacterized protein n=1 Tax=Leucosporidium creatinivorum TaxID=106004 RepID=A0A1Y2G3V0_9BASI|nr:hypothetical protein BCR35DRAFT_311677 [Leucosporidium creatinivorum]
MPPPPPTLPTLTPPAPPSKSSGRSAFRAPKWLRRGVGMGGGSSLKAVAEERGKSAASGVEKTVGGKTPMLERVRVMSVDGPIVDDVEEEWQLSPSPNSRPHNEHPPTSSTTTTTTTLGRLKPGHSSSTSLLLSRSLSRHASFDYTTSTAVGRRRAGSMSSTRSARSTRSAFGVAPAAGVGESTAAERDFVADLTFFALPPPHLSSLAPILTSTLRLVRSLVRDFEGSFAYIKGFDVYTVQQRIRKGIFDKAWSHLSRELMASGDLGVRLVNEEQTTLLLLLENVTLGLLHSKIYTTSILPLYTHENHHLNHLLTLYRSRHPALTPADLGVDSGVEDLESLLYFVKTFRLSDMLAPEFDWSFVTFQASLAFLLSDPLNALASSPLPPPPTIPFPSSSSPNPNLRASDLPSFRPRHSSVHQQSPYATAEQRRSPPSSPRSLRTISSAGWTSPAASRGHHHRAEPLGSSTSIHSSSSTSASLAARERRQSWQPGMRSSRRESVSPTPSAVDGRQRGDRMSASEQMPPPSWTTASTKHQRRQSLGVLPSSSNGSALGSPFLDSRALHEPSIPEGHSPNRSQHNDSPSSSDAARTRTTSVASSAPAQELQIRPRIVLPPRSAQSSFHRPYTPSNERPPNTPPLLRSQSNVSSRKIGPVSSTDSADMRRSESEGSPTVKRTPHADVWSLWGGSAGPSSPGSSERAVSPAASDRTSAAVGDEQSWWTWGRERLNSVGPSLALASPSLVGPTPPQTAPLDSSSRSVDDSALPGPRARRHSASAADMLGFTRTLSLPVEPPSSSSARLAAILAARNGGTTKPRPRSIMSVSSISSLESGASHSTALEEYMTAPISTASLPVPSRRRPTKSRTWRELPTSNLTSKPLAPKLDSSSVISFPTTASPSRSSSSASGSSRASPLPPQAFALPPSPRPSPRLAPPGSPLQRRHTEL